jgi:hypothetical protein
MNFVRACVLASGRRDQGSASAVGRESRNRTYVLKGEGVNNGGYHIHDSQT